jgi:hypothetical protein
VKVLCEMTQGFKTSEACIILAGDNFFLEMSIFVLTSN